MSVDPSRLSVARQLFERATGHLDTAVQRFQDIVETQEVTLLGRTSMGQRAVTQDLPAAYSELFRNAGAADALMTRGAELAGDVVPGPIIESMRSHLEQLRTNVASIDQYRRFEHVRKAGTVGLSHDGMTAARADAETAALLLSLSGG